MKYPFPTGDRIFLIDLTSTVSVAHRAAFLAVHTAKHIKGLKSKPLNRYFVQVASILSN